MLHDNSDSSLLDGAPEARYSNQTQGIGENKRKVNKLFGMSTPIAHVRTKDNYTVTPSDRVILVDAAPQAVTVSLPKAAEILNHTVTVKKIDSSGNAVKVEANFPETIDGAASKSTTTQYATFNLYSDGIGWHLL